MLVYQRVTQQNVHTFFRFKAGASKIYQTIAWLGACFSIPNYRNGH